ncbi:MAG: serine hydrolase [Mycobacterium kyogaense]|uniref:serine hydrolase domain-containing protein n=1 Tax=Mycobacterium kyogaense TaxID=2212479 RepID=UPI002FFC476A
MTSPEQGRADLTTLIAAIARHWSIPGGAVTVVDRHGVVFTHSFGHADPVAGIAVAPQHRFQIGSISKAFTAIAALRALRSGRLSLDEPVSAVLDWLPEPLDAETLTLRRLLNHTAGLVSSVDALPDDIGQAICFQGSLSSAAPGSFFHYSNLGYILTGLAVAQVSGRSLVDLVRNDILEPLGMSDSTACVTYDDDPAMARGYRPLRDDRPWIPGDPVVAVPYLEVAGADGNIATSIADLGRFARMLLGRGTLDGHTLLEVEEFAAMVHATAPSGEDVLALPGIPTSMSSRYGLGVNVEQVHGRTVLSHGGGMIGYASFLLADLDHGLAVCVLTNSNGDSPVAEALARTVAAEFEHPGSVRRDDLDPSWWDADLAAERVGEFSCAAAVSESRTLRCVVTDQAGAHVRLAVETGGGTAPLLRTWGGAALTRHRGLRTFALSFDAGAWHWGPHIFARGDSHGQRLPARADTQLCGHYRSYTPWFTNFRVVSRGGRLLLIAPGGVEAPGGEVELAPLGGRVYRIGADPRLPERLTFGPLVGGVAAWAERDGCRYSRAFTD